MEIKEKLLESIEKYKEEAFDLNTFLANNPEISGCEFKSCEKIIEILENNNIKIEKNFCNLQTAFKGKVIKKDSKTKGAILVEYDALEGLGHACGHSASAAISLLSVLALKENEDLINANIDVIGTPDEELAGAKSFMADNGVFDEYDFAIMIHISNENMPCWKFLALETYEFDFKGKPAHTAASPWEGRSALDALMLMIHSFDLIRKSTRPGTIIEGYIKEGGLTTNIIPERAKGIYAIRSDSTKYLQEELMPWIFKAANASAKAMETNLEINEVGYPFKDMKWNESGVESIREIMKELNISYNDNSKIFGSSDMGSVSHRCPAFHPSVSIGKDVALHTKEMADLMKTENAKEAVLNGAKIISLFVEKVSNDRELLNKIKLEYKKN